MEQTETRVAVPFVSCRTCTSCVIARAARQQRLCSISFFLLLCTLFFILVNENVQMMFDFPNPCGRYFRQMRVYPELLQMGKLLYFYQLFCWIYVHSPPQKKIRFAKTVMPLWGKWFTAAELLVDPVLGCFGRLQLCGVGFLRQQHR